MLTYVCLHIAIYHTLRFCTVVFDVFGFLAMLRYKSMYSTKSRCHFKIQLFLLGKLQRKLFWLRAEYQPNAILHFSG